jgi:putative ribosome biogenesis GTPase RsgA
MIFKPDFKKFTDDAQLNGEQLLVIYYDQKIHKYIILTKKDKVLFRYIWDGVSDGYNSIEVDYIIE